MCGSHCWTRSCWFSLLGTKLKGFNSFVLNPSLIFFTGVLRWGLLRVELIKEQRAVGVNANVLCKKIYLVLVRAAFNK